MSGSDTSWAICKSAPRSSQITTSAPHHSVFLQAGCPSCHPTNSVKALKVKLLQQQSYLYCAPYETVITLFPGVHRHTGTEIFFSRQLKVVVNCSSFSSACSLFCAHDATTVKACSHWLVDMSRHNDDNCYVRYSPKHQPQVSLWLYSSHKLMTLQQI